LGIIFKFKLFQEEIEALQIDDEEGQLHSIKAFAEFLEARKTYEPPPFLRKALQLPD